MSTGKLRKIPLTIIDSRESVAKDAHAEHHEHDADEGPRSIGRPPPCFVHVGETGIDEGQIAQEMQHHRDADPQRSRDAAARALVVRELLRLEVLRIGLDAAADAVDGETEEEAAIRLLIEREMPVPAPSREACERYFEANVERLHQPDRLRVRHILLAAAPEDIEARLAARTQGEALIRELREHPERFTEFAQRHSMCPSKDEGGELGWIERGDTVPEFERQLFMLSPGLGKLTLETRYGHHVVLIDEVARGAALSFDEAEPKIAAYLETQARQNAIHQYLSLLADRYGVRGLDPGEARAT
ncbi:peptidylprolyl isomerase [Dokdonella sp.]|uniref:peptidylprolyl isomerase n=1 Tax=Dokdonella sp. TaxID=2291710 RepID=UPI0025BA7F8D|nr:peptidylprolyl isomerase [Dokdonella sp.]MBX3689224.1 peptidylprolyl isomerase [Dokdonella sp.]